MKLNSYFLIARVIPAMLTSFPFFVLYYFYFTPEIKQLIGGFISIKVIGDISFAVALVYLLTQTNRFISKEILETKKFELGIRFSTTNYLLNDCGYFSQSFTEQLHQKIHKDFNIVIPSLPIDAENEMESRKIAKEAVEQIKIKVGKGSLVYQHNIEYGFSRNLLGGSIIAIVISIINLFVFYLISPNLNALIITSIFLLFYTTLLHNWKRILIHFANSYACVLMHEYMST